MQHPSVFHAKQTYERICFAEWNILTNGQCLKALRATKLPLAFSVHSRHSDLISSVGLKVSEQHYC